MARTRSYTQEQVLEIALRLADTGGAEALTIRGVATELGSAPNAVYTYFPTREALRAAVVDHVLGEVDLDLSRHKDWRTALRHLATGLHQVLAAHPGVVPLFVAGPMFGTNALASGEAVLAVLRDAGFTADDAAKVLYTLLVYTIGFAAMDAAELPGGAPPPQRQRVKERQAAFHGVPAEDFPLTRSAAGTMARYITTAQFHYGLDALIAGLDPKLR